MTLIFASILGAFIGSFLNMLTYRLPLGEPLVFSRSSCTSCKRPLSAFNLIPIVSFIVQRGRCTMCATPISSRYLFIELISALSGAALVYYYGMSWTAAFWGIVVACCIANFVIDYEHHILPHSIAATLFTLSVGYSVYSNTFLQHLPSVVLGVTVLYTIRLVGSYLYKQEALGMGDVIFMGAIGLFLPLNSLLLMLYIAFVSGGAFGLGILMSGIKNRTDALAFGPFLIAGFISALFFGDIILSVIWK